MDRAVRASTIHPFCDIETVSGAHVSNEEHPRFFDIKAPPERKLMRVKLFDEKRAPYTLAEGAVV